jgi:hypothetical protein
LIDCEEDRTLRAALVGMLREAERTLGRPSLDAFQKSPEVLVRRSSWGYVSVVT